MTMGAFTHGEEGSVASGRNDVVYLAPATEPYEAMPLGNGRLGVMVHNANGLTCRFYHGSFFSSADAANNLYGSGELVVHLPPSWIDGWIEQRLDLHRGSIALTTQEGTVHLWIAEDRNVLVVEIEAARPLPPLTVSLGVWARALPSEMTATAEELSVATVGQSGKRATALVWQPGPGATVTATGERQGTVTIDRPGERKLTLLVACPVAIDDRVDAESARQRGRFLLEGFEVEANRELHDRWWEQFWSKSDVRLDSPDGSAEVVENLYHLFLYWMAGCSRGPEAPKFNGGNYLFEQDWRSWGGFYWYQNTREMYWSLLPSDHAELWAPFIDLYRRNLPAARRLAMTVYGVNGACYEETMGRDGQGDKAGNVYTHLYLTTGTELAYQMIKYYQYTRDEEHLREVVYPILLETVTYHTHFLRRDAAGIHHVYPSNARETWSFVEDSVPDLAALRRILREAIHYSTVLGVDANRRPEWQQLLDTLAPYPIDAARQTVAPATLLDEFPPHPFAKADALYQPVAERRSLASTGKRFNSENAEMDPVWPWELVGLSSPAEEQALWRRTFKARPFAHWGFGNAWDPSLIWAARLGWPEEALRCLQQYLSGVQMFPQGMAGTPGAMPQEWGKVLGDSPAFDSAGVLAAGVQELLLQSYGGTIRLFPAMPAGWSGRFTLMAEGGFRVSAERHGSGAVPWVKIESRRGGLCRLASPWEPGKLIELSTKPGEVVSLTSPGQAPQDSPLPPPSRNTGPKWPNRTGPDDTAEAYLQRTRGFGFIGIAAEGRNPARLAVYRAMHPELLPGEPVNRPAQPLVTVLRAAAPPIIDGILNDAGWLERSWIGPFIRLPTNLTAAEQTQARLAWDNQALYVSTSCLDRRPEAIQATADTPESGGTIFGEDTVELLIQPEGATGYWHLAVNAAGGRYDAWVEGIRQDPSARPAWQAVTGRTATGWTAEIAIPWKTLGIAGTAGAVLRCNLGRNQPRLNETSVFAPLGEPSFHRPGDFARLRLSAAGPGDSPVLELDFEGAELGDKSPYGWAVRLVDGALRVPGRDGQVLNLDGKGWIEIPDDAALDLTGSFTLSAWVCPRNEGARLIDKSTVGRDDAYLLDLHPGNRVRFITPHGTIGTAVAIPKNAWTQVTAVYDAAAKRLAIYLNGEEAAAGPARAGNVNHNSNPVRLGADANGGSRLDGMLDEVTIRREAVQPGK